ncbi:unnamed protein product [Coccothraustes coccothraustes]
MPRYSGKGVLPLGDVPRKGERQEEVEDSTRPPRSAVRLAASLLWDGATAALTGDHPIEPRTHRRGPKPQRCPQGRGEAGPGLAGAHSEVASSAGGRGRLREARPQGGGGRRHVVCSPDPAQRRLPRRRRGLCAAAGGVRRCGGPGESQAGPPGTAPRTRGTPRDRCGSGTHGCSWAAGATRQRRAGRSQWHCVNGCVSRRAPAPAGVISPRGGSVPPPRRAAEGGLSAARLRCGAPAERPAPPAGVGNEPRHTGLRWEWGKRLGSARACGLKNLVSPWGHLAPEQVVALPKTESDS